MSLRFASKTVIFSFTVVLAFVFSFVLLLPTAGVAGKGGVKEEVCHITGTHDFDDGNGEVPVGHIISVSVSAYQAHIEHGDPEHWNSKTIADGSELCFPDESGELGTSVHKSPWSINPNSATEMHVKFETDTGVDDNTDHIFIDLDATTDCNHGDRLDCNHKFIKLVKEPGIVVPDTRLWTFTCDGLTPNRDYEYKICFRGWTGDPWEYRTGLFRTPPPLPEEYTGTVISPRLQFYAYGDSRGGSTHTDNVSRWISNDHEYYHGGEFFIHTGDIVFDGGRVCRWDSSDEDYIVCPWNDNFWSWSGVRAMLRRMPIFTTMGNHDFYGFDGPNAHFYYQYFEYNYPHNPTDAQDLEHFYYSFDWGPAKFWSLTNYPITTTCGTPTSMSPHSDQMDWFEGEVTENKGAWKIVYMHVAAFSCNCVMKTYRDDLVTLFQDHGVDVVLQGHNHYYARKTREGIPYLTLGGGGVPLEEDVNYPGCRESDGSAAEQKYHLGHFEIDHDYMLFEAKDELGTAFDTVLLDRHPKLDFSVTAGTSDYVVNLEHTITGHFVPDTCYWHFNDGTPSVSCDDESTHYFTAAGSYEITLTACSAFDGCSKYTRTIDVPVADDAHKAPVCTPAWSFYPNSIPGDWDNANSGAGIAVKDITGDGHPELFVFSINDNGNTNPNTAFYRIGWDLNYSGIPSTWSDRITIPNWSGNIQQGGGIAVADVLGEGSFDLFAFGINDPSGRNEAFYSVGHNLNSDGIPKTNWWQQFSLPAWEGDEQQGGGIAIANIDQNGSFEMIAFGINNPDGTNNSFYQIGWDLEPSNPFTNSWSERINIPSSSWQGDEQDGGGITIADIDKNGLFDLIAFGIDDPRGLNNGYYTIGWNINPENQDGTTTKWSDPISFPGRFGNDNQGGGITVADLNNNGYPDLIVFGIDDHKGKYLVGWDLQSDGKATSICSPTYEIGDTGPAGGCVFYVYDDGKHGMEVAPVDQTSAPWGCYGTAITGADGEALGTGRQNTVDILAGCSEDGIAAQIADEYSVNGYTDWFLPSFDELVGIMEDIPITNTCNFALDDSFLYWASSEFTEDGPDTEKVSAWVLSASLQGGMTKSDSQRVRAVRNF